MHATRALVGGSRATAAELRVDRTTSGRGSCQLFARESIWQRKPDERPPHVHLTGPPDGGARGLDGLAPVNDVSRPSRPKPSRPKPSPAQAQPGSSPRLQPAGLDDALQELARP
jgi:hypothetical protein